MSTIEVTQINGLADVPTEFWIAASIQILALIFGVWAFVKIIKFLVTSVPRLVASRFSGDEKTAPAVDPVSTSIGEDFADIEAAMKAEK